MKKDNKISTNGTKDRFDPVIDYINGIMNKELNFPSGFITIPYDVYSDPSNFGNSNIFQDKRYQDWGVLQSERDFQFMELKNQIDELMEFYTSKLEGDSIPPEGISPQDIMNALQKKLLRLKRLMCVLDPDYTFSEAKKRKGDRPYDMIKSYWYDDKGNKVRSFTKNVGKSDESIQDLISKLLTSNVKGLLTYSPQSYDPFNPDFIASMGKDKWAVEVKNKDKNDFVRAFVVFEMWKLYKKTYGFTT